MRRALAPSIAMLLIAAACGGTAVAPSPSPTVAASAAATATPKPSPFKLVVSYSNVIGDELPLWSTKEGGFFEQNALEIGDLQNIASAQGVPAVISGAGPTVLALTSSEIADDVASSHASRWFAATRLEVDPDGAHVVPLEGP